MLIVKKQFVGYGYNMPQPGELIDPPEPARSEILAQRLAVEYETKILQPPQELKKKPEPSASSHPVPARQPKILKSLRRYVTKLLR